MKSIIALMFSITSISTLAAEGKWTEGFGQGNLEYFIDKNNTRLYIACPTQNGSADALSEVRLMQISDEKHIEKFSLVINGITFEGPFSTDSRVGDNNFIALLEALHKGNVVAKFNGKTLTFPKSNAVKVIPVFGKNLECKLSM